MTVIELIKELNKYPPYYQIRIWSTTGDTDWEIEKIEYNEDNYPKIVFIIEGDD